ncbi:MAG: hypothetical protein BYD32DRAFT_107115 [Podila humilis]|nr:MAG: hypothetical protein BYD32DRAFT_107115 [Podila humilis]
MLCSLFYRFHAYHTMPCRSIYKHALLIDLCSLLVINQTLCFFLLLLVVSFSFPFSFLFFPIILSFLLRTLSTFRYIAHYTTSPQPSGFFFLSFQKYQKGRKGIHPHRLSYTPTYHHIHTYLLSCQVDVSSPLFKLTWVGYPKKEEKHRNNKNHGSKGKKAQAKARAILSTHLTFILWTTMHRLLLHAPCFFSSCPIPPPLFFVLFFFFFLVRRFQGKQSVRAQVKHNSISLPWVKGLCVGLWHRASSSFSLRSIQNSLLLLLSLVPVCLCQCCCCCFWSVCVPNPLARTEPKGG